MPVFRSFATLCAAFAITLATPSQAKLSDFDRSYNQSGCMIIARALELTAINYLTGVPVKDVLPRTRQSLDETKVPFDIKQIAMKKSGNMLGELLPLKSKVKSTRQALDMAAKIRDYNQKVCLDMVARG
jgi:hypothetical protein